MKTFALVAMLAFLGAGIEERRASGESPHASLPDELKKIDVTTEDGAEKFFVAYAKIANWHPGTGAPELFLDNGLLLVSFDVKSVDDAEPTVFTAARIAGQEKNLNAPIKRMLVSIHTPNDGGIVSVPVLAARLLDVKAPIPKETLHLFLESVDWAPINAMRQHEMDYPGMKIGPLEMASVERQYLQAKASGKTKVTIIVGSTPAK